MKGLIAFLLCAVLIGCDDNDSGDVRVVTTGAAHDTKGVFESAAFTISWVNGTADPLGNQYYITSAYSDGKDSYYAGNLPDQVDIEPSFFHNGVKTVLADSGFVQKITVSSGDVYCLGYLVKNKIKVPVYWKNAVAIPLEAAGDLITSSIFASGSDVYVSGWDVYPDGVDNDHHGVLWKNGVKSKNTAFGGSQILISGEDTYLIGGDRSYWKNGEIFYLQLSNGATDARVNSITLDGNDVYFAGKQVGGNSSRATYWKNGTPVVIDGGSEAVEVAIVNSDIYVLGYVPNEFNTFGLPVYWKNENKTFLEFADDDHQLIQLFGFSVYPE